MTCRLDPDRVAEAAAVTGNEIVHVGDNAGAEAFIGDSAQAIDATGMMMTASNWTKAGVDLFPAESKEDYLRLIKEYADANSDLEFIYGHGYHYQAYGGYPTAADLDSVVPDQKAFIFEFTIHDAWLNTRALEAGGITRDTPDLIPDFTYWIRDDDGSQTGAAIEPAWMPPYIDSGAWQREALITET